MDNIEKLFEENCFLPCIGEVETKPAAVHKDLDVLLSELEVIKNNIEEIKAKELHLAKLMKFHKKSLIKT